ncbi:hypothetical protein NEDG_01782 [Nematocida displodere]|uniref:Uncharacterized protein n=1 Tax=Nematocida displodere TaxID=1805483 RepID=A0A177EH53_9MICR|nr:hypothetical protein NEDG_01782 [Nematocida displodere]
MISSETPSIGSSLRTKTIILAAILGAGVLAVTGYWVVRSGYFAKSNYIELLELTRTLTTPTVSNGPQNRSLLAQAPPEPEPEPIQTSDEEFVHVESEEHEEHEDSEESKEHEDSEESKEHEEHEEPEDSEESKEHEEHEEHEKALLSDPNTIATTQPPTRTTFQLTPVSQPQPHNTTEPPTPITFQLTPVSQSQPRPQPQPKPRSQPQPHNTTEPPTPTTFQLTPVSQPQPQPKPHNTTQPPTPDVPLSVTKPNNHTEPTINLIHPFGLKLEMNSTTNTQQIVPKQTGSITIYLDMIELKNIPEEIEHGLTFENLKISSLSPSQNRVPDATPDHTLERLDKLLRALGTATIERLSLVGFYIQKKQKLPTAPISSVSVTKRLTLDSATSFFFAWLSTTITLGACDKNMTLELCNCHIETLKCLDALGLTTIGGLDLFELTEVDSIDCALLQEKRVTNYLTLGNLSADLKVSKALGDAIAANSWTNLYLDMSIWLAIRQSTDNPIQTMTLALTINSQTVEFKSLGYPKGKTPPSTILTTLIIDLNTTTSLTLNALENMIFGWIKANTPEVVDIVINTPSNLVDNDVKTYLATCLIPIDGLSNLSTVTMSRFSYSVMQIDSPFL